MTRSSVENKIKEKINASKRGTLFMAHDFNELGSPEAVRVALHRLVKENYIKRLTQGIYYLPEISTLLGELTPTAEEVAEAIAKRDKIRTIPTGSYALNALGLSTQIPMKIVLLTDGSPRIIQVGNRTIKFKRASPKALLAKGEISRLVIQALKEIGKDLQTAEEEKKIISILKRENRDYLLHDIPLAPVWIQKIMKRALQ